MMSLLNQVLRDLENRPLPDAARPTLRLATASPAPPPDTGRRRRLAWLVSGSLILAGGLALWWWTQGRQTPAPVQVLPPAEPRAQVQAAIPEPAPPPAPVATPLETPSADSSASAPKMAKAKAPAKNPAPAAAETPSAEYLPLRLRAAETPPPARPAQRPAHQKAQAASRPPARLHKTPAPLAQIRQLIAHGELSLAEERLRQRLRAAPSDHAAHQLLVGLLLRSQRHDEALAQIESSLARLGHDDKLVLLRARLLADQGQAGAALRDLEVLLARQPDDRAAMRLAAALYRQQGDTRHAGRLYRRLTALPGAEARDWLGLALSLDEHAPSLARAAWKRVLTAPELTAAVRDYARQRLEDRP
jgi:Flp pilus assembly protein TadD